MENLESIISLMTCSSRRFDGKNINGEHRSCATEYQSFFKLPPTGLANPTSVPGLLQLQPWI